MTKREPIDHRTPSRLAEFKTKAASHLGKTGSTNFSHIVLGDWINGQALEGQIVELERLESESIACTGSHEGETGERWSFGFEKGVRLEQTGSEQSHQPAEKDVDENF